MSGWFRRRSDEMPFRWEAFVPLKRFRIERRLAMPAKSKAQQQAAGAALAAKRGDRSKSSLRGASKSMMSMSEKELHKMASTKRKGKPEHAS
jgi:hypothetical protein